MFKQHKDIEVSEIGKMLSNDKIDKKRYIHRTDQCNTNSNKDSLTVFDQKPINEPKNLFNIPSTAEKPQSTNKLASSDNSVDYFSETFHIPRTTRVSDISEASSFDSSLSSNHLSDVSLQESNRKNSGCELVNDNTEITKTIADVFTDVTSKNNIRPTAIEGNIVNINNDKQLLSNNIKKSAIATHSVVTVIDSSDSEEEIEVIRDMMASKVSVEELQSKIKKQTVCFLFYFFNYLFYFFFNNL